VTPSLWCARRFGHSLSGPFLNRAGEGVGTLMNPGHTATAGVHNEDVRPPGL
jgi:hypothetical protein